VDAGDAPAGRLVCGGFGPQGQQFDHQPAQQAAHHAALLLVLRVQSGVEGLTGDQGFEDDVHAQQIAVERQCAIHVGHSDDEMAERQVGQDGHGVRARCGAGRPANNGRSR
jgi:hypothetical protein